MMEESLNSEKLKVEFEDYLKKVFLKNLNLILGLCLVILVYYMYSDWAVRYNMNSVTTRIPVLVICFALMVLHLIYRNRLYPLKNILYLLVYLASQLMMYAKCLIHLHEDALAPSVTGAILVIFLISLDLNKDLKTAIFIYTFPIVVFTFFLFVYGRPSSQEFFVLFDIYPILIVGFLINRIQYRLRFNLFKSNHLLKLEQYKTKALYGETLVMNEELRRKAEEAICIKEEIQEKNEQLNKSNATKDRFLAIIAHDLKNPIGNIWGLSDLLLVDGSIGENEKGECLKAINKSIQYTYELLENLLNWARAQNKAIVFKPLRYSAKELVEKELVVLRQVANKKNIEIVNEISKDFVVKADVNMFETIVRNLVSNAIKYSFPKGVIEISARVTNIGDHEFAKISIRDSGVGISEDVLSNLFSSDKSVSTKGTENEIGTGFGLLLCKEFVDIHNGMIEVSSVLNKGSVFELILPY